MSPFSPFLVANQNYQANRRNYNKRFSPPKILPAAFFSGASELLLESTPRFHEKRVEFRRATFEILCSACNRKFSTCHRAVRMAQELRFMSDSCQRSCDLSRRDPASCFFPMQPSDISGNGRFRENEMEATILYENSLYPMIRSNSRNFQEFNQCSGS